MNKFITPDKSTIEQLYLRDGKTMRKISEELGIAQGKVFRLIHLYCIPTREWFKGMKGKHQSQSAREKIGNSHRGKHLSEFSKTKLSKANKGKVYKPSVYGGHTKIHSHGYVMVYSPNHPYATKDGYVFEHILSYERAHSCIVDREKFAVHHINEIKTDNRPENLLLMTKSEHMSYHATKMHEERRKKLCKNLSLSAT